MVCARYAYAVHRAENWPPSEGSARSPPSSPPATSFAHPLTTDMLVVTSSLLRLRSSLAFVFVLFSFVFFESPVQIKMQIIHGKCVCNKTWCDGVCYTNYRDYRECDLVRSLCPRLHPRKAECSSEMRRCKAQCK